MALSDKDRKLYWLLACEYLGILTELTEEPPYRLSVGERRSFKQANLELRKLSEANHERLQVRLLGCAVDRIAGIYKRATVGRARMTLGEFEKVIAQSEYVVDTKLKYTEVDLGRRGKHGSWGRRSLHLKLSVINYMRKRGCNEMEPDWKDLDLLLRRKNSGNRDRKIGPKEFAHQLVTSALDKARLKSHARQLRIPVSTLERRGVLGGRFLPGGDRPVQSEGADPFYLIVANLYRHWYCVPPEVAVAFAHRVQKLASGETVDVPNPRAVR